MTLDALIILAGAIVAALPFLGFPSEWDTVIFFVAGVFTILLGMAVRRRLYTDEKAEAYEQASPASHEA